MKQVACSGATLTRCGLIFKRQQWLNQSPSTCSTIRLSTTQSAFSPSSREWSTSLAKTIAEAIQTTGPISLASYMRTCLTSPEGGYYSSSPSTSSPSNPSKHQTPLDQVDQFGKRGDFITSPEISQVFGELIGIWIVAEWMSQGKPGKRVGKTVTSPKEVNGILGTRTGEGVEIIELGPGRGTLMEDMLRTFRKFPDFASSITAIHLLESSPILRQAQKVKLCGEMAPMNEMESGNGYVSQSQHLAGVPVHWYQDMKFLPNELETTPFIIAHEFFDALPIHAFQSVPPQANQASTIQTPTGPITLPRGEKKQQEARSNRWRELVVTPTTSRSYTQIKGSVSLSPTPNSKGKEPSPEFQLSISQASNPTSNLLPSLSPRYKNILSTLDATIEISPEAQTITADIARRIGGTNVSTSLLGTSSAPKPNTKSAEHGLQKPQAGTTKNLRTGAALIIDYGPQSTVPISTLRGIRSHKLVSPFTQPGLVDLSADVDFGALVESALSASEGVEVHGPVDQGTWLQRMGIRERADAIVKGLSSSSSPSSPPFAKTGVIEGSAAAKNEEDEEAKKRIISAVERLVERGGGGMGRLYKVMAILPENGGRKRPVGFGGDL